MIASSIEWQEMARAQGRGGAGRVGRIRPIAGQHRASLFVRGAAIIIVTKLHGMRANYGLM